MRFEVEYMETGLSEKFPLGTVHTVDFYDIWTRSTRPRTGKVIGYRDPIPTTAFMSLPSVIFEDVEE